MNGAWVDKLPWVIILIVIPLCSMLPKIHPNVSKYDCHNNVVYFNRTTIGDPWNPVYKPDGSILKCNEIEWSYPDEKNDT